MINATNLSKVFFDGVKEVRAVDGVSFTVPAGKLFTLLGPSGCGKTTTLRCIAGLETPTSGEIAIEKSVVFDARRGISVPPNKRHIGMVFQSYAIWPHMTVFQNVYYPLKSKGFSRSEAKDRARGALDAVGLLDLEDRPAPRLSGGQQQRVALARALAGNPEVLLLDEPLSNLDAKLREEMRSGIRSLQKRIQITSLYVTHDQIEALTISDQIAVMHAGKIVEIGSPQDIYLHPKTRFAANFIGMTNIIPGKMKGEEAGASIVQVPFGEIFCRTNATTASDRVLVLVRPESLRLSSMAPSSGQNIWSGEIKEKIFLGDFIDCEVSCDGFSLRAKVDPYNDLAEGQKVYVSVDPARCAIIPMSDAC
ncbi:MAG TPA: ABC transporter ATP-binding protein [Candidatus Binatia bacterium]